LQGVWHPAFCGDALMSTIGLSLPSAIPAAPLSPVPFSPRLLYPRGFNPLVKEVLNQPRSYWRGGRRPGRSCRSFGNRVSRSSVHVGTRRGGRAAPTAPGRPTMTAERRARRQENWFFPPQKNNNHTNKET